MKKYIIAIALTGFQLTTHAQNQLDALRYSNLNYNGSARFNAMGGAFTAIGGDFSSTVLNPAGIGVYRSSELTFSPTFLQTNNDARFYNNPTEEGRLNFNIGSIGYVAVKEMDQNGWKSLNFGIGYSRTNSFSREYNLRSSGINDMTSLIYSHTNTLNTLQNPITQDQITARYPAEIGPAYETFLLDEIGNGFYDVRFWDASGIAKSYDVINRGGSGDLNLTVGGNYKDKLYVGAAVAFSIVNFNEQTTYREDMIYSSPADSTQVAAGFPRSTDFTRKSTLDVSGAGVNLKLGVIYRPVDFVRLGASIQSPTWLSLDETFSNSYESNFENGENYFFDYFSEFSYRIHTPWRTNLGLGLILGKKAIFSADYEYLNYSNARIRDAIDPIVEFGFDEANQEIKKDFSRAHNVRFGLEYRINAPYSLRAGFRYNDNPLNDQIADDLSSRTFSLGGGYKNENGVFVDFAYSLRQYGETVRLNAVDFNNQAGQGALLDQNSHLIQFTLGLRF
mgnify:CR=1 FL=1